MDFQLDKLDINILKLLGQNGRISISKISERLNVKPGLIKSKIEYMKSIGVIKKFTAVYNPDKLGINEIYLLIITAKEQESEELRRALLENLANTFQKTYPEIMFSGIGRMGDDISGAPQSNAPYYLFLVIMVKSTDHANSLVSDMNLHSIIYRIDLFPLKTVFGSDRLLDLSEDFLKILKKNDWKFPREV